MFSILLCKPFFDSALYGDSSSSNLIRTSLVLLKWFTDMFLQIVSHMLNVLFLPVDKPALHMALDQRNFLDLLFWRNSTHLREFLQTFLDFFFRCVLTCSSWWCILMSTFSNCFSFRSIKSHLNVTDPTLSINRSWVEIMRLSWISFAFRTISCILGFATILHRIVERKLSHNQLNNIYFTILYRYLNHWAIKAADIPIVLIRADTTTTATVPSLYNARIR